MFRIARIHDDLLPSSRQAIDQAQALLPTPAAVELGGVMRDPVRQGFRTILLIAEKRRGTVAGFALLSHAPALRTCVLEYLVGPGPSRLGSVGTALYERCREEALMLQAATLLLVEDADDPTAGADTRARRAAIERLRFLERYGARPVEGVVFPPRGRSKAAAGLVLVLDPLGTAAPPTLAPMQAILRVVVERTYGKRPPRAPIDRALAGLCSAPVQLREPRYGQAASVPVKETVPADERIKVVVTDQHEIHQVRDKGYVESPVRIGAIVDVLRDCTFVSFAAPKRYPERHIAAVHDAAYLTYFKRMCRALEPGGSVYPYVFPIRNPHRPPTDLPYAAGYYCIDTFTPLNRNAFVAAKRAVDCALTAADSLAQGTRLAYALVRPPGHHAERRTFGGFCYFNSAAVAAHHLSRRGKVALLDIDYHHGNGQQDIFYGRKDVLTVSIHGDPHFEYPYFTGFREEIGTGEGQGYNLNLPLPRDVTGDRHRKALRAALARIRKFAPSFLVVALGVDTAREDPSGTWLLEPADFEQNGRSIGALGLPTMVTQEGGYSTHVIGSLVRAFLTGLWTGAFRD